MSKRFKTVLTVIVSAWSCLAFSAANEFPEGQSETDMLRILFIGTSFTFNNDLPGILAGMSKLDSDRLYIEEAWYLVGGTPLKAFWEEGLAEKRIRAEGGWDYVVLQESSTVPSLQPRDFTDYLKKFSNAIRESAAEPLLFFTWAHENKPWMFRANNEIFQRVSEDLDIPLAPVGIAWNLALEASPDIELYLEDGHHPSEAGTYTAACVFYLVLFTDADACPVTGSFDLPNAHNDVIQDAAKKAVLVQNSYYESRKSE